VIQVRLRAGSVVVGSAAGRAIVAMAATLLVVASPLAAQQPDITASLTRDRIHVGETTVLSIQVESHSERAIIREPPMPAGLTVIGNSDFSQFQMSAPGRRVRWTRREVGITALAPGVHRIPPATVQVDGQTYRTNELILTVTDAPAGAAPPARPRAPSGPFGGALPGWGADDDDDTGLTTVLRLDVTPDTVYVGEQVLLNAEVTFAEASRFRQSRPASFEPPVPSGFWVQDLPDPVSVSLRVSEGRTVETQSYRRAYFPLSAGDAWFPPAHLHYELRRGFLQPPERRRVSSDSVRVVVRPLPQPAPSSFNGAVGTFTLDATLAPARVGVGEGAVLTVEVDGRGNVRALPEPRIAAVDGLELYAPSQESNMDVQEHVVGGRKRFRWMVVPERPGTYAIPSVEYAYFDPELQTYVTLVSPPLELEAVAVVASVPEDTAIRPLRAVRGGAGLAWARTPAFAAAQAVPLLLLAGALLVRRRRQRPPGPRAHMRRLRREIRALAGEPDDTARLVALERLLLEAVSCVAGGSSRYDEAADSLRRQGRDRAADVLSRLLHDIRTRRYAPAGEAVSGGDLVGRAADFVEALAPRTRGRRGALLFALAGGLGALTAGVGAQAEDPFNAAVARYQEGDVVTAANLFQSYARAHADDPNGWYNLGVAAHAAGDPGRAGWAWLRTLRIAPRDTDADHNLGVLATRPAGSVAGMAPAPASRNPRLVMPPDRLGSAERMVVPNLTVVDHPLIRHKLAVLRDRDTSKKTFRALVDEISMLMGYEATKDLPLQEVEIDTPLER
jgi:hypothetical protein